MENCNEGVSITCYILPRYDKEWMAKQIHDGIDKEKSMRELIYSEIYDDHEELSDRHIKSLVNGLIEKSYIDAEALAKMEDEDAREGESERLSAMTGEY